LDKRIYTYSPTDSNQDISFLKLHDTPPAGVMFAGWATVVDEEQLTCVHHPSEDWKKISFGNYNGNFACYSLGLLEGYDCTPSPTGSFVNVTWIDGGTEGGSSGSGLFNSSGQLVGTLLGGAGGDCSGSESDYSKFGAAYSSGNLSQWLDQPNEPVFGSTVLTKNFPDITIPTGSDAVIYGTAAPNHIIIGSGAKAELINFPGQNTIQLESDSSSFTAYRSGTIVTFTGSEGTVLKIPATREAQTISFNGEASRVLQIHDNQVKLDDQEVTIDPQTIDFDGQEPLTLSIHNGQVMLDDQVVTTTRGQKMPPTTAVLGFLETT